MGLFALVLVPLVPYPCAAYLCHCIARSASQACNESSLATVGSARAAGAAGGSPVGRRWGGERGVMDLGPGREAGRGPARPLMAIMATMDGDPAASCF